MFLCLLFMLAGGLLSVDCVRGRSATREKTEANDTEGQAGEMASVLPHGNLYR